MNRTKVFRIAVVALLLLVPVSSSAKDNWTKLHSKNFTIIGNAGEGDLKKLAIKLEEFRHVLSLIFPNARVTTPLPTTVYLFKNQDSFRPFKPRYKGKIRDSVAGYFQTSADGNYIALSAQPVGDADPLEIIFHEYEHFIIRNNLPNAPAWLDEGLAEFFSTYATSEKDRKTMLGNPVPRHIHTLREGNLLPLDTLLKVNRKSPHYTESTKAGIFYAQSWALVHYLMLHNQAERQPQLTKFIRGLSSGIPLEQNFRESFQTDYKTIENELRAYVRRFTFPVLTITFPNQLDFVKEVKKVAMPDAEVQYYLGDLLLRGRQPNEAEPFLQKSVALDANFPMSHISLGILRMSQSRLAEARKSFEAAIAGDSNNYLGHLHYAHLLDSEGRHEDAIESYRRAIKLKPDLAQPYSDLGYTYLSLGRDEEAIESFKRATQLDRMNPFLYWSRSYIYLRLNRGAAAAIDARTYLRMQGWQGDHSPYMALAAYFGYRQSKQTEQAAKVLDEALSRVTATEWPYPVVLYLQRRLTPEQLLALAVDNDKLTEAHAYIGLDQSLDGKNEQALAHLEWVRENGNKNFVEYPLALAEIERIKTRLQ